MQPLRRTRIITTPQSTTNTAAERLQAASANASEKLSVSKMIVKTARARQNGQMHFQHPPALVLISAAIGAIATISILIRDKKDKKRSFTIRELLSPAELKFFHALLRATRGKYHICCKVRVADIITASDGITGFRTISQKHADFVLCELSTMKAIRVIELDDKTHNRTQTARRDRMLDNAYTSAGIQISHIQCKRSYDPKVLEFL